MPESHNLPQLLTNTPLQAAPSQAQPSHPECFRLPRASQRDPYFGLSRSWFYSAERDGRLAMIRLRQRGKLRGVTLVPYDAVAALIRAADGK